MHRLARLVKDENCDTIGGRGPCALHGDRRFEALRSAVRKELEHQVEVQDEIMPRCWSTMAWSYATLQLKDDDASEVLHLIAALSIRQFEEFKPFELTNLVWAFAKAQVPDAALFERVQRHLDRNLGVLPRSSLSTMVWAFVTAGHQPHSLLRRLAGEFAAGLSQGDVQPVELANLMWGLASAQLSIRPCVHREVGNAAVKILPAFKLKELSITLWAFSRLGVCHDELFTASALLLGSSSELRGSIHPQGIANLLWAFAKQALLGASATPALRSVLPVLLPTCDWLLPDMKPQEFGCMLSAITSLGFRSGDSGAVDRLFAEAARVQAPLLHRFSLRSCVHALTAVVLFTQRQAQPPQPLATLARKLAQHSLKHRRDLDLASAAEALEFSGATCHHLPEVAELLRVAAAFALKHIDDFSSLLLTRLATAIEGWDSEGQTALAIAVSRKSAKLDLRLPSSASEQSIEHGIIQEKNFSEHEFYKQDKSSTCHFSSGFQLTQCSADSAEMGDAASVWSENTDSFTDDPVDDGQESSIVKDELSFAMHQSFHNAKADSSMALSKFECFPSGAQQQISCVPGMTFGPFAKLPDCLENISNPKMAFNAFAKEFVPLDVSSHIPPPQVDVIDDVTSRQMQDYVVRNTFIDLPEMDKEVLTRRLSANTFRSQPQWRIAAPAV